MSSCTKMDFSSWSSIRLFALLFVFSCCKSEGLSALNSHEEPDERTGLFSSFQGYAVSLIFKTLQVTDVFGCTSACLKEPCCQSFNFDTSGNSKHLCELSQGVLGKKPRQGFIHYFAVKLGDARSNTPEQHCQLKTGSWLKVGNAVCIGAKDDQFGNFTIPVACHVLTFKLVYVSGGGISWAPEDPKTYWGTAHHGNNKDLNIHITDDKNNRINPPSNFPMFTLHGLMMYSLPGVTNTDPELTLPELSPPLVVTAGKGFRIWVDEDLKDSSGEANNDGQTCADVWIKKY